MSASAVVRTVARAARRRLWPTPEEKAWRTIRERADRDGRRTPGELRLMDLDIAYVDALSLAPQWHDMFVRKTLAFRAETDAPRVLDCGANIGVASIWIKRQYPRARITAFEADPAIFTVLQRNLQRNNFTDIEAVHAAVWRDAQPITFRSEGTDSGAIDQVAANTPGTVCQVPAVRLRDYLWNGAPVDLLKLDIEGAEGEVLADAVDALDRVRAIHLEVHDFDAGRRLLPGCLDLLGRRGFEYALDDFASATWRTEAAPRGPFAKAVPAWIVLVRAWRPFDSLTLAQGRSDGVRP
jgi:FkbM family methyltransferase